jgi:hypothetical protein
MPASPSVSAFKMLPLNPPKGIEDVHGQFDIGTDELGRVLNHQMSLQRISYPMLTPLTPCCINTDMSLLNYEFSGK